MEPTDVMETMFDADKLQTILSPATSAAGWRVVIDELCRRIGADLGLITVRTPLRSDPGETHGSAGFDAAIEDWRHALRQTETLDALRRLPHEHAVAQLDLLSETATDPSTRSWASRHGFARGLGGMIWRSGPQAGLIALMRREPRAFEESEQEILRSTLPHLEVAISAQYQLERVAYERDIARDALDGLYQGVILAAENGRIIHRNRAARELLSAGEGLCEAGGRVVPAPDNEFLDEVELLRHLENASSASGTGAISTTRSLELRRRFRLPIAVSIVPLPRRDAMAWEPDRPTVALFLSAPERFPELAPARLQLVYGLTSAEAEIAIALATGESVRSTAERSGRSEATLRKHLQSIFGKTGTHRQSELVSMLLRRAL